ncbi:MAG: nucleoside deaminase [Oscillospiraceae bacterium]|jgi:tRNA(adenine34) deaminase|nr:nucleoside deaminase [Oscillospiraceae bacterium]
MKIKIENKKEFFMQQALNLAKKSALDLEVPVGAVVVLKNKIIASGQNTKEFEKNALCHAEIKAICSACKFLGKWRLKECEIYVTLEPCPMCAGAIINSRISKVFFGASDPKSGCCGSITNLFDLPFNHLPQYEGQILENKCKSILKTFFKKLRS